MSVVNDAKVTTFTVREESDTLLRFELGTKVTADAKKEQLSDTKITSGKMTFTISN